MATVSLAMHELTHPLTPDENLEKQVTAIQISNRLSLLERKISNVFLWNAYEELLTKEKHCMRVQDLAEMIGFESHDQETLKTALKSLMSTVIEWNVFDEKGREKDWEACTMLAYARTDGSCCYYSYPNVLRQKLYNPAMYERINISIQRRFSSGYALALYENCVRFRKVGHTGWIPLATFRKLMGVEPREYQDFRRLNARVIKEPVQQVNSTSDILITVEYQWEKRRISAIRFSVKDNPRLSLFKGKKLTAGKPVALSAGQWDSLLAERLQEFGLSPAQAEEALRVYDTAYIEGNLQIVERYLQAGKIRTTLAATTLDALKKDYRPRPAPREAALAATKTSRKQERTAAAQLAAAEEEDIDTAAQELITALANLNPEAKQALQAEFITAIEAGSLPGATTLQEQYRTAGFDSIIVQSMFRGIARERLLTSGQEQETVKAD